jgi:hypothetical protein
LEAQFAAIIRRRVPRALKEGSMRLALLAAGVLAASAVVSFGGDAQAQGTAFGRAGELGISWDQPLVAGTLASVNPGDTQILAAPMTLTPLGFQYYTVSNNGVSGTVFDVAPALDYFVVDNLSIGAQVMFGVVSTNSTTTTGPNGTTTTTAGSSTTLYGIGPQVGYNIPLGESISFWPKVFFGYVGASGNNTSLSSGTIGVFAPFLFHIATHFYAGAGPDFSTQLFVNESQSGGNVTVSNNNPPKTTTVGAMVTFGGWFNLGGG